MQHITSLIPSGKANAIGRDRLAALAGVSDREARRMIQQARADGALILNDQDGGGYYLATTDDLDSLARQYRQDTSRAMAILRRRKRIRQILKAGGYPV